MGSCDFLLSEAFWTEQIIAAGITAIVTLVVALVAVGPALKILGKDVESHAENLSRDHHDLDSSIKEAEEATRSDIAVTRSDIAQLANMTAYLRDEQMKAEVRREELKGQSLDVQKGIDLMTALADRVGTLEQENAALREENRRLRTELAHPPKKKSRNG